MASRARWFGALVAIVIAGLVWRRADLGLPFFFWKYGGSALWGAMVYAIAGCVGPRSGVARRVLVSSAIAILLECSRLYHTPGLDAFRLTLAGALLLGRLFSPWNMVAYVVGIAAAAAVERIPRRRPVSRPPLLRG